MPKAEFKKKNSPEMLNVADAEALRIPEVANSPMSEVMQSAPDMTPAKEIQLEKGPEKPGTFRVERLANDGRMEQWNAYPVTNEKGVKMYYLDKEGENQFVRLPETEYLAEQEMREATEKFAQGKVWGTITALLTESENGKEEHVALQQYLDENKGRILEYAALSVRLDRQRGLSEDETLEEVKAEVKAAAKAGAKGHFEIDYAKFANSLNVFASDYLMSELDTTKEARDADKLSAKRVRVAAVAAKSFQHVMGKPMSVKDVTVQRDALREFGDDRKYQLVFGGEITRPLNPDSRTPEEQTASLLEIVRSGMKQAADTEKPLSLDELDALEDQMVDQLIVLKYAESARDITRSQGVNKKVDAFYGLIQTAKQEAQKKGSRRKKAVEPSLQLEEFRAAPVTPEDIASMRSANIAGSITEEGELKAGLDQMTANREETEPTETIDQTAEVMQAQKSPARRAIPVQVEYEPTNLNIAPNQENGEPTEAQMPAVAEPLGEQQPEKFGEQLEKAEKPEPDILQKRAKKIRERREAEKAAVKPKVVMRRYVAPSEPIKEAVPGFVGSLESQAKKTAEYISPDIGATPIPGADTRTLKEQLEQMDPRLAAINPSESAPSDMRMETTAEMPEKAPKKKAPKAKKEVLPPPPTPAVTSHDYEGGGGGYVGSQQPKEKPKPGFLRRWWNSFWGAAGKEEEAAGI